MGLRIIDRPKRQPPPEVSEAELVAGLSAASAAWSAAYGSDKVESQRHFLEQIRRVRARFVSPAEVTAGAQRILDGLGDRGKEAASLHHQVDIATLLELL